MKKEENSLSKEKFEKAFERGPGQNWPAEIFKRV